MVVLLTVTAASAPTGQGFTLLDARTEFVKASRRYDLVVDATTYTDNGADRYINNGIRILDRKIDHPKQFRSTFFQMAVGDNSVIPEYLMHPRNIWISDSGGRVNIINNRMSIDGYRKQYSKAVADQDSGTPIDWALYSAGLAPSQIGDTSSDFTTAGYLGVENVHFQDAAIGPDWNFNTILLGPKADAVYTVEIDGKYYSRPLTDNSDQNYWTVQHPELVVQAAIWILERNNRNAAGMRAAMEGINEEINTLDNEVVEWDFDGFSNRIGEDN